MTKETENKNLLELLAIDDEISVEYYRNQDGVNYLNDYSPMDINQGVEKIERLISFGGKVILYADHVQGKWQAHSEGELVVYRIG
ncbi:MAG: hypothetical protein JSV42_02955 [Chloroflexota bacterium]|nr:MAG: hypothetical protein JSV42_02955 [Chloroflexota bacterium]